MTRLRTIAFFLTVTISHLLASISLLVYLFGIGMERFDTGVPAAALEQLASGIFAVLRFPLLTVLERLPAARFPGLWGYVPIVGNAVCWGAAAVAVRWRFLARRTPRTASGVTRVRDGLS